MQHLVSDLLKSQWIQGSHLLKTYAYPILHETIREHGSSLVFSAGNNISIRLTRRIKHNKDVIYKATVNNHLNLTGIKFLAMVNPDDFVTLNQSELLKLLRLVPFKNWPLFPGMIVGVRGFEFQISGISTDGNTRLFLLRSPFFILQFDRTSFGIDVMIVENNKQYPNPPNLRFTLPVLRKGFEDLISALRNPQVSDSITEAMGALENQPTHDRDLRGGVWNTIIWPITKTHPNWNFAMGYNNLPVNIYNKIPIQFRILNNFLYKNQPNRWINMWKNCYSFIAEKTKKHVDKLYLTISPFNNWLNNKHYTFDHAGGNKVKYISQNGQEINTDLHNIEDREGLTKSSLVSFFCPTLCVNLKNEVAFAAFCACVTPPALEWRDELDAKYLIVTRSQNTAQNGYSTDKSDNANENLRWWASLLNISPLPEYEAVDKQHFIDLGHAVGFINIAAYTNRMRLALQDIRHVCDLASSLTKSTVTVYIPTLGKIYNAAQYNIQIDLILELFATAQNITTVRIQEHPTFAENTQSRIQNIPRMHITSENPCLAPVTPSVLVIGVAGSIAAVVGNTFWAGATNQSVMEQTLLSTFANPMLNPSVYNMYPY
jgi:hypothetical protein